ncbi:MAG: hypothetical protein JHC61_04610 [Burkholderiaceae bacterium]|nr:hypothetical protein [Burkholderiaceae bacterium]
MNNQADLEQYQEQDIDLAHKQNVQDAVDKGGVTEDPVATDHFEMHLPLTAASKVQDLE